MLGFFSKFFGAFVGWLILAYLGLEGLGVFVFLVFVFLFCVAFVSVLFALFLFCCWIVFGGWFLFYFFGVGSLFCFLVVFCFLEGFLAQRATSLGPKPFWFVFVLWLFLFFFFFFLLDLTWPLNPPYLRFVFFVFFLAFLSLILFIEKPCSPPPNKKRACLVSF